MSGGNQHIEYEATPALIPFFGPALVAAIPVGDLSHLASSTVLTTILASTILLLLGVLIRLRQFRIRLERETRALKKSENHLRLMGDNLPSMTIFELVYSNEGAFRFTFMSKGYERILGFACEDALADAQAVFDHIYEEDLPLLKKTFLRGKNDLLPADLEIRALDANGNQKWLRTNAIPHHDGDRLIWDGFMQDISAVKNNEAAVLEENRNFQNLFHTIDDFLLICDMDGRLIHTNPAVENRLKYSGEALQSMSIFELYPEDARVEAYQLVARMQSEASMISELPLQTSRGALIPVEMNVFQGAWENRRAIFGVARDVARHEATESALRESQRILQLIIDTIPMSIFWKDKDSVYLGCNKTFIRECGLDTREQVVGKTPPDLFDSSTAAKVIARDQKVIHTNQAVADHAESHTRPDGSIGWREIHIIPLHDEDGHAVGVLGVWRDVSEQNRAEERLKRTLEDMERFNQLMRGRERRTLELKAEINQLLKLLGQPRKYVTTTEEFSGTKAPSASRTDPNV